MSNTYNERISNELRQVITDIYKEINKDKHGEEKISKIEVTRMLAEVYRSGFFEGNNGNGKKIKICVSNPLDIQL